MAQLWGAAEFTRAPDTRQWKIRIPTGMRGERAAVIAWSLLDDELKQRDPMAMVRVEPAVWYPEGHKTSGIEEWGVVEVTCQDLPGAFPPKQLRAIVDSAMEAAERQALSELEADHRAAREYAEALRDE